MGSDGGALVLQGRYPSVSDGKPCTIFDLTKTAQAADSTKTYPPPINPYLPVCLKHTATHPLECLSQ